MEQFLFDTVQINRTEAAWCPSSQLSNGLPYKEVRRNKERKRTSERTASGQKGRWEDDEEEELQERKGENSNENKHKKVESKEGDNCYE